MWSLLGSSAGQILFVAGMFLTARELTSASFGTVGFIHGSASLIALIIVPAVGVGGTRLLSLNASAAPKECGHIAGTLVTFSIIAAAVGYIFFYLLESKLVGRFPAITSLSLNHGSFTFLSVFTFFTGVQSAALAGLHAFKGIAILNFSRGLCAFLLMPLLGRHFGIQGSLLALVVSSGVLLGAGQIVLHLKMRQIGVRLRCPRIRIFKQLCGNYAAPSLVGGGAALGAVWLSNAIVLAAPEGAIGLARLNTGNYARNAISTLAALFSLPLLPLLSEQVKRRDKSALIGSASAAAGLFAVVGLVAILVVVLLAKPFLAQIGPDYAGSEQLLVLLVTAGCISNVASVAGVLLQAMDQMWIGATINVIWSIIFISICWWLRSNAAMGVCIAYVVSYMIHLAFSFVVASRSVAAFCKT